MISPYYAELRDLEYSFDSNAEKFRTMMVINEMNAEQMRFEAGNEFEKAVANMDRQGDSVPFTQQDIDNIELDELTKDQKEDELLKAGLNKMIAVSIRLRRFPGLTRLNGAMPEARGRGGDRCITPLRNWGQIAF